ncbi:hypothetical protein [Oceanobacillus halophilus]|uniref:Lipoprotein n=1 Tax=Oceanobacillus halophilus TaxID=930130 RepID=A0A495A2Y8_9BACI|nr:hypothetical protein [Oceanobacillus halophilus]RKQ33942.1 hypothetical protein D8M06_08955 [Oceanobacillus halophilus]
MKRFFVSIIIITMVLLVACSTKDSVETQGDATIQEAKLTDFEKQFTDLLDGVSFVHDIEIKNDQVKEISTTVDVYQNGEYKDTVVEFGKGISETEKEETIRTVFLSSMLNKHDEKWMSAVMTNSGSGSGTNTYDSSEIVNLNSSAWGGITDSTPLFIGEKLPIASIVYSNKESIVMLNHFSRDEALEKQTNYEQVYILSVEIR